MENQKHSLDEETQKLYAEYNLKFYSKEEEVLNTLSHGIGVPLAFVGLVFLLKKASSPSSVAAAIIFILSCIFVYGVSALYHGTTDLQRKSVLRRLDHAGINFIISGCGAPICLCLSDGIYNYIGMGICLALGIIGATLCVINLAKFSKLALAFDFITGAILTVVFLLNRTLITMEIKIYYAVGLGLVLLGAILYSIRKPFAHFAFHCFTILGPMVFYFGTLMII